MNSSRYVVVVGGSFRHFLWQIARELQSPMLNLLVSSNSTGQTSGRWIIRPGRMTYAEEQLLRFLGQVSLDKCVGRSNN